MGNPQLEIEIRLQLGALDLRVDLDTTARSVALVGPSGAGKSTILRVIAGVERRAAGTVRWSGEQWQDGTAFLPPWRRGAAWVPQDGALFPHLDVARNLAFAGAKTEETLALAKRLDILHLLSRMPRHLSGGERQRVALGRALLAQPRLLLLDEPFAALEPALRTRLAIELASICEERSLPIVLVSHGTDDVAALATACWRVEGGRVQQVMG